MVGHPSKLFSECTERTKRMKELSQVESYTSPELVCVVLSKFQKAAKRDAVQNLNQTAVTNQSF